MKSYVILLASGTGSRFGGDLPKQFVQLDDKMVVEYAMEKCMSASSLDGVIVVVSKPYLNLMRNIVRGGGYPKPVKIVIGGATRRDSICCGMRSICDVDAKVLIHNAVQPCIDPCVFDDCVDALGRFDAVTVGSPSVYTVLELDDSRILRRVVDRSHSVNDLGPECFKLSLLKKVFDIAGRDDAFTNITGMVVKYGLSDVYVVDGAPSNIKITYPQDLDIARILLSIGGTNE